jgi:hypothetical protein
VSPRNKVLAGKPGAYRERIKDNNNNINNNNNKNKNEYGWQE